MLQSDNPFVHPGFGIYSGTDLFHEHLIFFVVPPKFCVNFSWDDRKSQAKLKTMLMQNVRGTTKSIMIFFEKGL